MAELTPSVLICKANQLKVGDKNEENTNNYNSWLLLLLPAPIGCANEIATSSKNPVSEVYYMGGAKIFF